MNEKLRLKCLILAINFHRGNNESVHARDVLSTAGEFEKFVNGPLGEPKSSEEPTDTLVNAKITDQPLGWRTIRVLVESGIHTVGDLISMTKQDIHQLKGFDIHIMRDLADFMVRYDLSFAAKE